MRFSDLPIKAQQAIEHGLRNNDPIVRMEFIGLPLKTINDLEESEFEIIRLKDLLNRTEEELLSIPGFAKLSLKKVYAALARYDELEDCETSNIFD